MKAPGSPSSPLAITYFGSPGASRADRHFFASEEAAAAASAEAGTGDFADHVFGRHRGKDFGQRPYPPAAT